MPEEKADKTIKYWGLLYEMIENFHKYGGLRIVILYELKDKPLNGVEISKQIEIHNKKLHEKKKQIYYTKHEKDLNDPFTRKVKSKPSPGSLYPKLKKMREEGLIVKLSNGKYQNTKLGNDKLHEVLETLQKKEVYFNENPLENTLADLDFAITRIENINEEELKTYEDDLLNLSKRLKKIAVNVYSQNIDEK
ncbi:MAG: PadR family transcriptional regulator [Methanobacteriaceae archaeon]|jgi:DNA-binding PadR family transcriptional regulator|uniref:PadR family transcriptional regulator n=1 Tax=unclassified Methanobrevibacter TaxID=2638681 RepID=UPI002A0B36A5|nr:PadR family transcriptional regulator [Methanobacteriaceae archaeon]MDD3408718.1 PadR family transcriptional regulator [Methanobacteriaceae archaeon]